MERKVTFRLFCGPFIDEDTGEECRGEFCGSFTRQIKGINFSKITMIAESIVREKSSQDGGSGEIRCQCEVSLF